MGKGGVVGRFFLEGDFKLDFRVKDVYYRVFLGLIFVGERKEVGWGREKS